MEISGKRVGTELDVETGRKEVQLAALNLLAFARKHLGSLDRATRIVRLGVSVATVGGVCDQAKVADAASELLRYVFGSDKNHCRLVYDVASLPPGTPVERQAIFEICTVRTGAASKVGRLASLRFPKKG